MCDLLVALANEAGGLDTVTALTRAEANEQLIFLSDSPAYMYRF